MASNKKLSVNTLSIALILIVFTSCKNDSDDTNTGNNQGQVGIEIPCDISGLINQQGCNLPDLCLVPLTDLGINKYKGFQGGLYPNGKNTAPQSHINDGLQFANQITPLDSNGNPNANGKIVLLSLGLSNSFLEFKPFVDLVENDGTVNQNLLVINGAQPGVSLQKWSLADATASVGPYKKVIDTLQNYGATENQVHVIWMKHAFEDNPTLGEFPIHVELYRDLIIDIIKTAKSRYPNLKLIYLSSRTKAYTFRTAVNSPEPYAYELGFGVKWLIEEQINGNTELNYKPQNGTVNAPWIAWGPYLWANSNSNPRSDGFFWDCIDTRSTPEQQPDGSIKTPDFVHPSEGIGTQKIAQELLNFFKTDISTKDWFLIP